MIKPRCTTLLRLMRCQGNGLHGGGKYRVLLDL